MSDSETKYALKGTLNIKDAHESENGFHIRLQALVDAVGNPNAFSKATGLSVNGVRRYLEGGEPTVSKVIQICNSIGVNPGWLLTGQGAIEQQTGDFSRHNERAFALATVNDETINKLEEAGASALPGIMIAYDRLNDLFKSYPDKVRSVLADSVLKFVGLDDDLESFIDGFREADFSNEFALIPGYKVQVSAGHGLSNGDSEEPYRRLAFRRKWLKYRGFNEKDLTVVWASGDSMEPTIGNNDTLVVHMGRTKPVDGNIYVFRNGDELFVKRYQNALGKWRLISDSPMYPDIEIPKEEQHQFQVIGQVVHISHDVGE